MVYIDILIVFTLIVPGVLVEYIHQLNKSLEECQVSNLFSGSERCDKFHIFLILANCLAPCVSCGESLSVGEDIR